MRSTIHSDVRRGTIVLRCPNVCRWRWTTLEGHLKGKVPPLLLPLSESLLSIWFPRVCVINLFSKWLFGRVSDQGFSTVYSPHGFIKSTKSRYGRYLKYVKSSGLSMETFKWISIETSRSSFLYLWPRIDAEIEGRQGTTTSLESGVNRTSYRL